MHEFGMCEAVVEAVEQRADGRRVEHVTVRIGDRHRVVPDVFEQGFALAAQGTVADGAGVEMVFVSTLCRCRVCGASTPTPDGLPVCAECGSADAELVGGDELVLESLVYAS